MKYLVLEIQVSKDGSVAMPAVKDYNSRNEAESSYFNVLSYAAVSTVYKHSALIVDEEGTLLLKRTYVHDDDNLANQS